MKKKVQDEEEVWEFRGGCEILLLGPQPPAFTEQDRQEMIEAWEKEKQRRLLEKSKEKPED